MQHEEPHSTTFAVPLTRRGWLAYFCGGLHEIQETCKVTADILPKVKRHSKIASARDKEWPVT